MTISQTISPFPTPIPSRNDPTNFAERADSTLGHLNTFVAEENTLSGQINSTVSDMNALLASTEASKNSAEQSAISANNAKNTALIAAATAGYKGFWAPGTTYAQGDTVIYLGRLFISNIKSNIGITPTDGDDWALLGTGRIFIVGRYI